MTKSTLEQVKEFHETYGLPVENSPNISDQKTNDLRINLLAEELDELKEALKNDDIVETLDALIDLQYVLDLSIRRADRNQARQPAVAVDRSRHGRLFELGAVRVRHPRAEAPVAERHGSGRSVKHD